MAGCDACGAPVACRPATARTPNPADIIEDARLQHADQQAWKAVISHETGCAPCAFHHPAPDCVEGVRLRSVSNATSARFDAHRAAVGLPNDPF